MQFLPIAQATPITSERTDLPMATVEESSDTRLSLDLRENTSIPGDLIRITLDKKEDIEIIKLQIFKYWIESKGMTKDKVDDLLMMLFYLDSSVIERRIAMCDCAEYFTSWKPKYMLLNGMRCRSVAVAPNLVEMKDPNNPEATYIDYYSGIMKKLYATGWKNKENVIVEAGLIPGYQLFENPSVHPYCITIDKKILEKILMAVSQGIKVIVSDMKTIKNREKGGTFWKEKWIDETICYSDTPCDYKASPQFARYGIDFKKDESYTTVSAFVEPYITCQIDWNNLQSGKACVLI
jgi:hypothetical protein